MDKEPYGQAIKRFSLTYAQRSSTNQTETTFAHHTNCSNSIKKQPPTEKDEGMKGFQIIFFQSAVNFPKNYENKPLQPQLKKSKIFVFLDTWKKYLGSKKKM